MNYSFVHVPHIFMHPFLVPYKLQNPAGKMLLSGENIFFLTWQKKKDLNLKRFFFHIITVQWPLRKTQWKMQVSSIR